MVPCGSSPVTRFALASGHAKNEAPEEEAGCKWRYDSCDSDECCHSEECDSDKFSYLNECCDPDECFTLTSVVTLKNIEL